MAAAPRVSEAARLLSPKIDIARDRLKEQVLPAIVDAVNRAAEVAAQSAGAPALVVQPPPKKHRLCRFLGWSALLGALGAIAYAVWARRELDADPWSEDDAWGADDVSFVPTSQAAGEADSSEDQPAAKEALSDLGSAAEAAAEAVGEKTGEAVRKVSSASKKAAEAAHTAVGKAKRAAASVADAARQTTSSNDDEEAGGQSAAPSADSKDDAGKSGS
ncbi:MAG: hypothetical protein LBH48_02120 [Bifidobacteriaceae bacterium]|nr:hypothetical protein [Bifidobacteriaceae bacterium]